MIAAPPTIPNCVTQVAAPHHLMLACGDGNFWLDGVTWQHWGDAAATGTGTAHANDCTPNCAAGHFHTYRVTAVVGDLRTCTGGRRQYTRLLLRYPATKPAGYPNPEAIALPCRSR